MFLHPGGDQEDTVLDLMDSGSKQTDPWCTGTDELIRLHLYRHVITAPDVFRSRK